MQQVRRRANCTLSSSQLSKLNWKTLKGESEILLHVARSGPVIAVIEATNRFVYYG